MVPSPETTLPKPLSITYMPIDRLIPNPKNPRKHDERQLRLLTQSILANGFVVPMLADKNFVIIAGHGRWLAAKRAGLRELPVVLLEGLTDAQIKVLVIADNRLYEMATWDDQILAEWLKELSALELGFSLDATGFTVPEIDFRIESLNTPAPVDKPDPLNEIPALQQRAVVKIGDLWLLGKHRLLVADARDEQSYILLLDGKVAAIIFTDPPYNLAIKGHVGGLGAVQHREFSTASGEMNAEEFLAFLKTICELLARFAADGSLHFVCMDWRHLRELLEAGHTAYTELKNICVWVKDNGGMGSLYRSQHEMICLFKKGTAPHRNNVELGKHGRYRTNVWNYPGCNSFSRKTDEGDLLAMHPTVKPVAMVADALLDCSARGDIVLDPFLGSGTTLIAAERTGRVCYGIEIDSLYADTIIRRWQRLTGKDAVHVASGKTFNAIEVEMEVENG